MTPPRSVLDSLATLAAQQGSAALGAMSEVVAKTERWSSQELERHQLRRLARLLEHARATVPFYSRRPVLPDEDELALERFRELPLLSRGDVRERPDELVSSEIPPGQGSLRPPRPPPRHSTMQDHSISAHRTRTSRARSYPGWSTSTKTDRSP
jgi:hypothetical protein